MAWRYDRAMIDEGFDPQTLLDSPELSAAWLRSAGVVDPVRGHQNLLRIAQAGVTLDLLGSMLGQLEEVLPQLSDADMALNNLERFYSALRSPLSFATLCQRDDKSLPILLRVFSTSQYLSDVIIRQPTVYDEMRRSQGAPVSPALLSSELMAELAAVTDDQKAMRLISAFKRRHMVRIAYGDIIRGQRLETVTRQISYLADAICQAALSRVQAALTERFGTPRRSDGKESGFVVLGAREARRAGAELFQRYRCDLSLRSGRHDRRSGSAAVDRKQGVLRSSRATTGPVADANHAQWFGLSCRPATATGGSHRERP